MPPHTSDDHTPRLQLPYLAAAQAQKHVTVNEALAALDGLVQTAVESADLAAQPAEPPDGALYILPPDRTGPEWSLHPPGTLIRHESGDWTALAAGDGALAYVRDTDRLLLRRPEGWAPLSTGAEALQNIDRLGLGTTADEANPLAAKLNAALFTARPTGEGGTGDLRLAFNKEGPADVGSLLFQSGYSGRAELGLVGDDDLRLKVSADGAAWTEALRVERATGRVWAGNLAVERSLAFNLLPDSGRFVAASANGALSGVAFAQPTWLSPFGNGTFAAHAPFLFDNADYGGAGGALDPHVRALIDAIRPPGARRYGPEWWVLKVTRGTTPAEPLFVEGASFDLAAVAAIVPLPRAVTVGYHLRVLSGGALVSAPGPDALAIDGQAASSLKVLGPADGWRYVNLLTGPNASGYEYNLLSLRATAGAQLLLAMPRIVFGHLRLDPTLGLMPNGRVFG